MARTKSRIMAAIARYRDQGLNSVPLCPPRKAAHARIPSHRCSTPGKVPLLPWKPLQHRMATDVEIAEAAARAFAAGSEPNAGVFMGHVSGIVSLDADGSEAVEWVHTECGEEALATASFVTGKGVRWVYALPPGMEAPSSRVVRKGVEILSLGRQSVFPPSLHPSGKRYAWAGCDSRTWSKRLIDWPFGTGRETKEAEGRPTPHAAEAKSGSGERRIGIGDRNRTLFSMACSLRRQGAGYGTVLACLEHLNRMCAPPLDGEEVAAVAASACRYAPSWSRGG